MKKILQPVLAAGLMLTAAPVLAASPAASQQGIKGVGVVSLPAVVANSNAYKTAEAQRPVTYKAQYDQAETRRAQIAAQLQPLITKFNADRSAPNANQQALQQQAVQINQIQQSGQQELQQILAPVALSRAYVEEQIEDKLNDAVQNAAKKRGVTLILDPTQGAIIYADAQYNMTQDVLDELNTLLPSAQLVPPAGWEPRAVREQKAAEAQQAGAAGQPAGPSTQGR
ncbi:MAG: OmpH family outer membrane protein [Sphingomonadales bacterium]|nr:OmpH family outer membrane protein [Sphingomonadales bacterium]MBD3772463.1 OmpH family outer membrane protein [Paracoccaceae bacterium]